MRYSLLLPGGKTIFVFIAALLLPVAVSTMTALSVACLENAFAQTAESGDRTLSPYFFVKSDDSTLDQLPLKSTSTTVNISGNIADVAVVQVYKNEGQKPLEAVYVFPASTRASVYGMKMTIGERTITARIQKREEARQTYEQAKQEGKSASLLEQNRPNVFQMNVADIMPGDEIKTELSYTEIILPVDRIYEFVYPTVTGPRYSNRPADTAPPSEKWSQNPYLHEGQPAPYSFDIKVRVAAGVPIQEMSCPSHKTAVDFRENGVATVSLDPGERSGGNRDFILRYRLAGNHIESGLLLYEGKDENFFLLTAQPPDHVTPADMPPREYIFIVDVSGSMHGFPLEISKKLVKELLTGLRPTDLFNVMTFSGGSDLFSDRAVPAGPENVRRAVDLIQQQAGGGGTELLPAMQRALSLPRTGTFARTIVIATDGYVTVEPEVFDLIREHIGNANIFSFGIGTSVNRHLIEGMARVGAGESFVITHADEAPAMAQKFRKYIDSPVLTQIRLDFGGFEAYDVEPTEMPDVFAERPAVVYGKWRGKLKGMITLSGMSGSGKWEKKIDVADSRPSAENSALRYLWAGLRVAGLTDYNTLAASEERVEKITALGLKYNLLTAYTSFVAVDTQVRRDSGSLTTVKQPLPLPQGVSDLALPTAGAPRAMAFPTIGFGSGGSSGSKMSVRGGSNSSEEAQSGAVPPAPTKETESEKQDVAAEPASKVEIVRLTVGEGIPGDTVRRIIERNLPKLSHCLGRHPASAELTLEWEIGKHSSVTNVRSVSPDGVGKAVNGCVGAELRKWVFPAPGDKKNVKVTLKLRIKN